MKVSYLCDLHDCDLGVVVELMELAQQPGSEVGLLSVPGVFPYGVVAPVVY